MLLMDAIALRLTHSDFEPAARQPIARACVTCIHSRVYTFAGFPAATVRGSHVSSSFGSQQLETQCERDGQING